MAEEFNEYEHYVMIGKWTEDHAEQIKALAAAGNADAKTFIELHNLIVAHADEMAWAMLAAVYGRLRPVVAQQKKEPLPESYKPASLRKPPSLPTLDVKYIVGVWNIFNERCEGALAGPFDTLEAALDIVPEALQNPVSCRAAIFRQPGDKLLYCWNLQNETWYLHSSVEDA